MWLRDETNTQEPMSYLTQQSLRCQMRQCYEEAVRGEKKN